MSGALKSVKKVFKKAVKVVRKVAPVALGVGALVFTAGAALGVPAMAGGWSGAVSSLVGKTGATGMLGSVLSGAIEKAGYGAIIGGVIGGKDGLEKGALGGAVVGGVMGGFNYNPNTAAAISGTPPPGSAPPSQAATPTSTAPVAAKGAAGGAYTSAGAPIAPGAPTSVATPASMSTASAVPAAAAAPAAAPSTGGLFSQGGWIERNGALVGSLGAGVGQGLLASAGDDDGEALLERDQATRDAIAANYGAVGTGLLTPESMAELSGQPARPKPAERFSAGPVAGKFKYDPKTNRVEFIPATDKG